MTKVVLLTVALIVASVFAPPVFSNEQKLDQVLSNQKKIIEKEDQIIANQKTIIDNQAKILKNQETIKANVKPKYNQ